MHMILAVTEGIDKATIFQLKALYILEYDKSPPQADQIYNA